MRILSLVKMGIEGRTRGKSFSSYTFNAITKPRPRLIGPRGPADNGGRLPRAAPLRAAGETLDRSVAG